MNALIYDIEIINAIQGKNEDRVEGITYCSGWQDHENMGISVIGAYDYAQARYRVFCKDNFDSFLERAAQPGTTLVTFNGLAFDDQVIAKTLKAVFPQENPSYDLLVEVWVASGLGPKFSYPSHIGFGLDAVCERTFGVRKTGHGALAPIQWQNGMRGTVIDYCLNDVYLTKLLFDAALEGKPLVSPKDESKLTLRTPA